jgi:hypothetical protein
MKRNHPSARQATILFQVIFMTAGLACATAGCANQKTASDEPSAPSSWPAGATTRPATSKPAVAATAPAASEGMSLFDSKTLGQWKPINYAGAGEPLVEDGNLIIPVGERLTGVVWGGPELPKMNYEISLVAKRVDGSDFFCGLTFPIADSHATLILGGWGGALCGISSVNGEDAAHNNYRTFRHFDDNHWYRVRVRVTPAKVQAWVDNDSVFDIDTAGKTFSVRGDIEESKPLGLATFQTTGAFKDIRLKKLK